MFPFNFNHCTYIIHMKISYNCRQAIFKRSFKYTFIFYSYISTFYCRCIIYTWTIPYDTIITIFCHEMIGPLHNKSLFLVLFLIKNKSEIKKRLLLHIWIVLLLLSINIIVSFKRPGSTVTSE